MRIIKKGRPQVGWAKETVCTGKGNGDGGCGAKLLIEEGDLFKTYHHCYGDSTPDVFITFRCPECGVETDIEDVSGVVTSKLPDKKNFAAKKVKPMPKSVETNSIKKNEDGHIIYEINSFEDFVNVVNEENCDMLCGNFYGVISQFIKMRKKVPGLKFSGFNWIDDGKLEVRNPKITVVVDDSFELGFCSKCFQMTNHIAGVCQKCK